MTNRLNLKSGSCMSGKQIDTDKLEIGDVIIEILPHGLYSCIVIVDKYRKSLLFYIADYLSEEKPQLDHPRLKQIYISEKFSFINNGRQIKWGNEFCSSSSFEYLGNIEILNEDFSSTINEIIEARSPYWDWLEKEDKQLYERESTIFFEEDASIEYKYMSEKTFWSLINQMFPNGYKDECTLKVLSSLSEDKIIRFNNRLAVVLDSLKELEKIDESGEGSVSENLFLYQRCFVVIQGRKYYKQVMKNDRIDITNLDDEYEELLDLPIEALESKGIEVDYNKVQELV